MRTATYDVPPQEVRHQIQSLLRSRLNYTTFKQLSYLFGVLGLFQKGNSNFVLGTAICYVNVENYFLTFIKHIAVPSTKLEFPI